MVPEALTELRAVVDRFVALDPDAFADVEVMEELQREFSRLSGVHAVASQAFHASGVWSEAGARNGAAWIAGTCRLPASQVRRRVRLGRCSGLLPLAAQAWLAGHIDEAHVEVLLRARGGGRAEAMARDEAMLVGHAIDLPFKSFHQAVAYWIQLNDPDGAEGDAADLVERRSCHVSPTLGGMVRGDFELDPIRGSIVDETLREIYDEFFRADWAEAKHRLGTEPTVNDLCRTAPQRRADALVEMAIRARTAPKGGKRPKPLFSVYVDYESTMKRLCELANGAVVTPGSLLPWLTEAEVERVVFDGERRVIDLGRRRRLFRGATRRAVQLRDRECFHPLCDEPAERCQIDHIEPFRNGGETTTANGQPACGFHNRDRERQPRGPDNGPGNGDKQGRNGSQSGRDRQRGRDGSGRGPTGHNDDDSGS